MRDHRCHASAEVIAQSLVGNHRQEHLFALKQAVELFEFYQAKIAECEAEMEKYLASLPHVREDEPPPLPGGEKRQTLCFNVREHAYKLIGVDLFRISGLNSETVLRIVSGVGVDLSAFPSEKHYASWLLPEPEPAGVGREGLVESNAAEPESGGGLPAGGGERGAECE